MDVAAAPTFASYSALLRRRPPGVERAVLLFTTVGLGAMLLLPAHLISVALQGGFEPTAGTVGPLEYAGVFSSALAFFAWNRAIALIGAARAGMVPYLQPVCVALLSCALLGETMGAAQIVCRALILGAVALGAAGRTAGQRAAHDRLGSSCPRRRTPRRAGRRSWRWWRPGREWRWCPGWRPSGGPVW